MYVDAQIYNFSGTPPRPALDYPGYKLPNTIIP